MKNRAASRDVRIVAGLALALLAACGRDVTFVEPQAALEQDDTTSTDGGDPTVVRGNLMVVVKVVPSDASIAQAVGANPEKLEGVVVSVRRTGQASRADTTNVDGVAAFTGLVTGLWTVSAIRTLGDTERGLLPPSATDVTGFAGGATVAIGPGDNATTVAVIAGRQGTLVISEVFPFAPPTDGNDYLTGMYIELVNNGFETVFLDGMIVGLPYLITIQTSLATCNQTARWREDSLGVWTREFAAFPGDGDDYPVAPGQTVVVATDAIDHTQFAPSMLDLTAANFEFIGSSDVDNPAVPNMVNVGLAEHRASVGHGILFGFTEVKVFLAMGVDPDTLPQEDAPSQRHVRIPRDAIRDIFTTRGTPEFQAGLSSVFCGRMTHQAFDAQHAELYDYSQFVSLRRRTLFTLGDGRVILQRTRNSALDFESGAPTPGRLP